MGLTRARFSLPLFLLAVVLLLFPLLVAAGHQATGAGAKPAPIGVNAYEVDGVEVALISVKRISDGSLTATWEYRNTTDEPKRLGASFTGMGSSEAWSLVYHSYLADAKTRIEYPVAKDIHGEPVGSKHGAGKVVVLPPHKTMSVWAKFLSVPQTLSKISVFVPGTAPFEDVPITE